MLRPYFPSIFAPSFSRTIPPRYSPPSSPSHLAQWKDILFRRKFSQFLRVTSVTPSCNNKTRPDITRWLRAFSWKGRDKTIKLDQARRNEASLATRPISDSYQGTIPSKTWAINLDDDSFQRVKCLVGTSETWRKNVERREGCIFKPSLRNERS